MKNKILLALPICLLAGFYSGSACSAKKQEKHTEFSVKRTGKTETVWNLVPSQSFFYKNNLYLMIGRDGVERSVRAYCFKSTVFEFITGTETVEIAECCVAPQ